jgi:hypothetical protein
MKHSRTQVRRKERQVPELRFERQRLTSFAGLVILQLLFETVDLKNRLRQCFRHLPGSRVYEFATIFLQLVIHILLGYRELRDSRWYCDDPLVKRLLGLRWLPDVATISRALRDADDKAVQHLRELLREMVLRRLAATCPTRVSLDFDGSVLSTGRSAEGTAVGFNKRKKGARSYYPLFCTVAQTGQVVDFLHRSGNVHDSNGARGFILACIEAVRQTLPSALIEVRMDSAFFSDEIIDTLDGLGIELTVTVPFERFVQLKQMIERRRSWKRINAEVCYFERCWKPKSWKRQFRFVFVRSQVRKQQKGPVQLDLFIPYEYGHEFKVIVTNKAVGAETVIGFHDGRGSQEGIFGELKSHCAMGYVPVRRRVGNQIYLLASLFAHNLVRELQMIVDPPSRGTTRKRAPLWIFQTVETFRRTIIQRAGRLTKPQGRLVLTINAMGPLRMRLVQCYNAFRKAS